MPRRRPALRALSLTGACLAALLAGCSGRAAREPASVVAPPAASRVPATTDPVPPVTTTATAASPMTSPTTASSPAATSAPPAGAEWTLLAVGDVLMDDTEAAGLDPFAAVVPALAGADLAVVNAEMAIATGGVPEDKTFTFRALPSAAARMAAAGVDVANLGNNHSLDFGAGAMLETIAHLRAAGVAPVGAGSSADAAYAPAMRTVGAVRVAVVGASRVFHRPGWAAGAGPGVASAYDRPRLLAAVRAARAQADVVIVAVHWGREGSPCPEPAQEQLGAALLDAGASVVLGSHPHVLQPIVADDRGLVAYSLGNFVFHRRRGTVGESGVLEVSFSGSRVVGYRLHPHVLDDGPPRPAGPAAAARIAAAAAAPCP
ncbi:MAG: CapA family protein, partial [Acidimicrobiales bacterium]